MRALLPEQKNMAGYEYIMHEHENIHIQDQTQISINNTIAMLTEEKIGYMI